MEDIKDLQMYPHFKNATTVSDYLERTDENMLVLLPAHEKLTKSITRYKKSTEDLKDSDAKFQQVLRRAEELEQLLLETKEEYDARFTRLEQEHDARFTRLEERVRKSDSQRLAGYKGNLIIEMVQRLSDKHNIESEVRGNDPEACKKKLVRAAHTLMNEYGTAKKKDGHVMESEEEVKRKWQTATGLLPKYMLALKKFEEIVQARNVLAHETAGQLAQLLMEREHYKGHNYHYLGGLIRFLYGKTVEEMAEEEDHKDTEREAEEGSED